MQMQLQNEKTNPLPSFYTLRQMHHCQTGHWKYIAIQFPERFCCVNNYSQMQLLYLMIRQVK